MDQSIGRRLRFYRMMADVSQKDLGQHLGMSFQQIQKYENGTNRMAIATAYEAAKCLNITVLHLVEDLEDNMDVLKEMKTLKKLDLKLLKILSKQENSAIKNKVIDLISHY